MEQSKFTEAIEILSDLLRLYPELNNPEGQQRTLGLLCYCAVSIGEFSNAKIFCEKALLLAKKINLQNEIQIQQENLEFINRKLEEQG
jgi:hypothetical protein